MYGALISHLRECAKLDKSNNTYAEAAQPKWTPADEKKPSDFVSVQAHMTDAGVFPSVREGYVVHGEWFFPALGEFHPVDKWMPFSEPGEG